MSTPPARPSITAALESFPVATILVLVFAIVGGILCITNDLTFASYLDKMAVAAGGLAIGRGIAARK